MKYIFKYYSGFVIFCYVTNNVLSQMFKYLIIVRIRYFNFYVLHPYIFFTGTYIYIYIYVTATVCG